MRALSAVVLSLILLGSPGCPATLNEDYVKSDRATFDLLTPKYLDYVHQDPTLKSDEKDRRERTVTSWRLRLEQAEKTVSAKGQ